MVARRNQLALAHSPQRLVDCDPRQPRRQDRIATKILEMREQADVGVLHDVLCLGVVPQDASRQQVKPLVVRFDDRVDRGLISGFRALDEIEFVGRCVADES
jgi:hypothetical protein